MRKYIYAAYETKSQKELCIGVFRSMENLARSLGISTKSAWCNLYRTLKGRSYAVADFVIHRIEFAEE